jgi:RND family efflux transporter MFP subunit
MRTLKLNHILLLSVATLFAACSGDTSQTDAPEEVVKTVNVSTIPIEPTDFASYLRVVGTVETSNDIMISAEVTGKLLSYSVNEGDKVRKGQVIARIDDAKLKQEKARLEAVTAQSLDNYERLKQVYEQEGIGSEMEYLNAKYAYEQNNSALQSLKVDLANTEIKAPFNGSVETIMIEEGEIASPGMPVVRLIGSDNYIISAGVPARYASAVSLGDKVEVWFDSMMDERLEGTITYVGNSINASNRTFRIEVKLPGNRNDLKVDMIGNMVLKTLSLDNVIVVSEEFVYSKDDGYTMYVIAENEEGKTVAEERIVDLGPSYKTNVVVEGGLQVGEKLITIGSAFLNDGMRVSVINKENNAVAAQ